MSALRREAKATRGGDGRRRAVGSQSPITSLPHKKARKEKEEGRVDRIRGRQKEDMEERAAREKEREWGRD